MTKFLGSRLSLTTEDNIRKMLTPPFEAPPLDFLLIFAAMASSSSSSSSYVRGLLTFLCEDRVGWSAEDGREEGGALFLED